MLYFILGSEYDNMVTSRKNWWNKCKKHFIKMLKDVGMVEPKTIEMNSTKVQNPRCI